MGLNKNKILGYATGIMVVMGLLLIGMGIFKYSEISGWGFVTVGIGFLANAWVFNALKGRV
ncbi:MAG TPA: CAL67264 family membrane protein [Flavobacterium sp.]|nr:CAL67264 family membrane protein [Flavobacterium sp.]